MSVVRAIRYTSFGAYWQEPLKGHYGRTRAETMLCPKEEAAAIWRIAQAAEQAAWNAAMRRGGCDLKRCPLCKQEAILPRDQALCAKCGG